MASVAADEAVIRARVRAKALAAGLWLLGAALLVCVTGWAAAGALAPDVDFRSEPY